MTFTTLVDASTLHQNLNNPDWVIVDCRFSLSDPLTGVSAYRHAHIPYARYADLNQHLSSPVTSYTGRHPLPDFRQLSHKLGEWGIKNSSQVVAYDDVGGAFAARLWWLLRWIGHTNAALLDGGISYWQNQKYPLTTLLPKVKTASYRAYPDNNAWLSATDVRDGLAKRELCLIDARTPIRFRGEQEPIDPVAGHISGALNRSMQLNLEQNQLFLPKPILRKQFKNLLNEKSAEHVVHMCGSGVTACHNLLAMEHAGLSGSKLYAGSWSEWIRNKNRPIKIG
jgi:thiosulfate/3-mercaptopyruvate sulfurtransferase